MPHRMRLLFLLPFTAPFAQSAEPSVAALRWLSGCWASVDSEPGSGEFWTVPAGGSILGMSRTVRGGRTIAWEFVRIVEKDDGGIDYIASPAGQETTAFTLIRAVDGEVVFENPSHDFPQRVIYRRLPGDGLLGRIEGVIGGKDRSVDFPMKKSACEE